MRYEVDRAVPLAPIDESVQIPESVKRAAAAAEEIHKQAYQTPDPPAEPLAETPVEPVSADAETPPPIETPAPPPAEPQPSEPPVTTVVTPEQWEHRYHSMRGRYEQASHTIGSMQEQMQQLGDELMRTQALMNSRAAPTSPTPQRLLTDEDEKTYGPELIDVVKRAAKEAMSPTLATIEQENKRLQAQVTQQAKSSMYGTLDDQVPEWREINRNPRFVQWLRLPDIYSGEVRQQMLNRAFQAAQAPRVAAFFKGFLAEEVATGQMPSTQTQAAQAPRASPATTLEAIAAPGRARPATGDTQVPVEKPVFTRQHITDFYNAVRQGRYNGRDADKTRDEAAIFNAQREGRVR